MNFALKFHKVSVFKCQALKLIKCLFFFYHLPIMLGAFYIVGSYNLFFGAAENIFHQYQVILLSNIFAFDCIESIDFGQEGFWIFFVVLKKLLQILNDEIELFFCNCFKDVLVVKRKEKELPTFSTISFSNVVHFMIVL